MEAMDALRVSRTAEIQLNAASAMVFPLFTPLGERLWVEDWNPQIVYPPSGDAELHGVFLTSNHAEQPTIWTIVEQDAERCRIGYVRVAPDSHVAFIVVECADNGPNSSVVMVSYTFTGLSAAGNDYVARFTPEYYQHWIQHWEAAINRYLAGAPVAHAS